MTRKRRALSYFAMAGILLLMLLSFFNQTFALLTVRDAESTTYDPSDIVGYAELLEAAAPEQPQQPKIGYACKTVTVNNTTIFDEIPGLRSRFDWGWELFDRDASEYSETLAVAAVSLMRLDYRLGIDYTSDDIRQIRESLGFTHTEFFNRGGSMNVDRPVTIISSAKAAFPAGEKTVVFVDIRGTRSTGDALTDMKAAYNGFALASENVSSNIRRYMETCCADAAPEDTVFFVIGHSLGGACAGLQARLLEEAGYPKEQTFIYTFASPKYRLSGGSEAFPNVKNHIISKDYVPRVPLLDGRYGEDIRYNDPFPAIRLGDALALMTNVRPDNALMETLTAHHSSATYLIEVCAHDYAEDSFWENLFFLAPDCCWRPCSLPWGDAYGYS